MVLLDNGGRPRHEVELLPPPADLRGLVEHVAILPHSNGTRDWRVVPDASPHLIATIVDVPAGCGLRVALVGSRSRAAAIDLRGRIGTVAVRFRPGALPALVRDSAAEFTDRSVTVDHVFPRRLLADLQLAPDVPPSLLASELIRMVRRAARRAAVGPLAETLASVPRVRGIIEALGVPERTLRDRVQREIGLSPKSVLRILRLHQALRLARHSARSWAAIADLAGYADQAHLTRECRALLGETPGAWAARGLAGSFKTGPRLQS